MTLHTEHYILIPFGLWMLWVTCTVIASSDRSKENSAELRSIRDSIEQNNQNCHERISEEVTKLQDAMDSRTSSMNDSFNKVWERLNLVIKSKKGVVGGHIGNIINGTQCCICPVCLFAVEEELETPRQSKDVKCGGCGSKVRVDGAL